MSAFRLAWEQGADGIEADFFLSADGHVVCIHDENTKKTGSAKMAVEKSTLAQLRELEYGAWKNPKFKGEPIPLLTEILDELPEGKWFFIEIKDSPEIVEPIAKILEAKQADKNRVVLISFNAEVVRACRETLPGYRACLVSALKNFTKEGQKEKYLDQVRSSGSQGIAYKENAKVSASWLSEVAGEDGILTTWTVNTPQSALRAISRGAKFLITDRPGALRAETEAALKAGP